MVLTGLPGMDWPLFGGAFWIVLCMASTMLVTWVVAQVVLVALDLTGRD